MRAAMAARLLLVERDARVRNWRGKSWEREWEQVGSSYKDGKIAAVETFLSKTDESPDLRKQTQDENMGWYKGISADIFG